MTDSEGLRKALESAKAHLQRISEWAKNDRATWGITLDNIEVEAAIQVREIERALDAVSPPAPCEGCGICMKDCPHQPAPSPAPAKPEQSRNYVDAALAWFSAPAEPWNEAEKQGRILAQEVKRFRELYEAAPAKPFITESDAAGYERDCNNGE